VVWEAIYQPFGEIDRYLNAKISNNFRFPGQYEDELTGLYYNHFRYYIADLGRYNRVDIYNISLLIILNITEKDKKIDPLIGVTPYLLYLQIKLSNPKYLNSYLYTLNNPLLFVDREGSQGMVFPYISSWPSYYIGPPKEGLLYCARKIFEKKRSWQPDTFRHCSASCEISKECGGLIDSFLLGLAWEIRGIFPGSAAEFKDLKANLKGLKISLKGKNCEDACRCD